MATQVLTNAKILLDSLDISGDANAVSLEQGVESQECTAFGTAPVTKIFKPGLMTAKARVSGYTNYGSLGSEELLSSKLSLADVVFTVGATGLAEGELGWSLRSMLASFNPLAGQVGEMVKFSAQAEATNARFVRGTVLHNAAKVASGNGTAFQVGAAAAGQTVYAALHLLAFSGTSLAVKVQSDTVGFPSPTDRLTFATLTAIGSDWQQATGAITDDYWRANYTLVGASATFVVSFGIH